MVVPNCFRELLWVESGKVGQIGVCEVGLKGSMEEQSYTQRTVKWRNLTSECVDTQDLHFWPELLKGQVSIVSCIQNKTIGSALQKWVEDRFNFKLFLTAVSSK